MKNQKFPGPPAPSNPPSTPPGGGNDSDPEPPNFDN